MKEIIYIAYNKPKGIVCTTEKVQGNIIDAISFDEKLLPVGRLDKESEGLILLTNDFSAIDSIINPSSEHEKEYEVTVNVPLRGDFIKKMSSGVVIGDATTLPCKVVPVKGTRRLFRITLKQGLNRQIRRMCGALGYQVVRLQRIRIKNISLGRIQAGEYRILSAEEITDLKK